MLVLALVICVMIVVVQLLRKDPRSGSWEAYLRSLTLLIALSISTAVCLMIAVGFFNNGPKIVEGLVFMLISYLGFFASTLAMGITMETYGDWRLKSRGDSNPEVKLSNDFN